MKRPLRHCLLASLLFALPFCGNALPAYPGLKTIPLPDGTTIELLTSGDEYHHYITTSDGYPVLRGEDGFFYYARLVDGALQRTERRAFDPADRPADDDIALKSLTRGKVLTDAMAALHVKKARKSPLKIKPRIAATANDNGITLPTSFPTIGKRKALAILVDFAATEKDNGMFHFLNPNSLFTRMLNQKGFNEDGATGSVHDYYYDSSNGQFDLTFDVFGPVTMDNSVGYYGRDEVWGAWRMVVEACEKLDDKIDFSQYDQDGDGIVDNIYVFYAGENEADSKIEDHIWPHAANIFEIVPDQTFTFDGKKINHYACSNERVKLIHTVTHETKIALAGIGNVCHEFTHVMGFPDLYNTIDQLGSFTPNQWSIMDLGSYNNLSHTPPTYSAYERLSMGWIEPYELTKAENYTLRPIQENQACIIRTSNPNEAFLLENRQKTGWDKYLPGHGMLIWHIAYDPVSWNDNTVNNIYESQRIDLEEADAYQSYDSFAGDAYPGTSNKREFTDESNPSMRTLVGMKPTRCPLTEITETEDGMITFKVKGGYSDVGVPEVLPATDLTPISFTAQWGSVGTADSYLLSVWDVTGETREPLEGFIEKSVTENSCAVTGLQAEHSYIYIVQAVDEAGYGAPSAEMTVTTPAATFAYIPPTALPAEDVTLESFTARWESLAEAESYLINVYTKEQGTPATSTVDFTGGVSAMPTGWEANANSTVATNGNYGAAAPALSFAKTGLYLQTPITKETIRGLQCWYKEANAPSGTNRMIVKAMNEAGEWNEIDAINLPSPAEPGQTYTLPAEKIPAGARSLRIEYELNGRGALRLDDVVFSYGDNFQIVPLDGWVNAEAGEGTSKAVTDLQAETKYFYTVAGVKGNLTTVPSKEISVTTTTAGSVGQDETENLSFTAITTNGILTVKAGDAPLAVYNTLGVKTGEIAPSSVRRFRLPAGLYLVTNGKESLKVIIE